MRETSRIACAIVLAALASTCGGKAAPIVAPTSAVEEQPALQLAPHAQLVLFMMARCPHCADLLATLLPLKRELGDAVSLSIAFVGDPGDLRDAEARAAQVELCVGGNARVDQWFGFLECLYGSSAWRRLPDGFEECAAEQGIDTSAVGACLRDGTGEAELAASMAASAAKGIRAAPMLFIDGRLYAGDRSRRSLLSRICYMAGAEATRPALCAEVDPPPPVVATLLEDARCTDPRLCDVEREVDFLRDLVPSIRLVRLDFATEEGAGTYAKAREAGGPRHLPLLVFDKGLEAYEAERQGLEEYLIEVEDGYLMPLGMGWDPTAEICDNAVDDDGDGDIDCADDGCRPTLPCRAEKAGRLDLFTMSRCPFGMEVIEPIDAFLEHMGRDRRVVDFHLQFIGEVLEDGALDSMHGDLEVEEDLRMICAQALYPERYAFMDYVACRARDYTSPDWEACVSPTMSSKKLRRCAEGAQGRELLAASFALAAAVGMDASPSFLLNDKVEMDGRTPKAILAAYCARNEAAACGREIADLEDGEAPAAERCR